MSKNTTAFTNLRGELANASDALLKASSGTVSRQLGLSIVGLAATPAALAAGQPGDWEIRTATLAYAESDRVTAIEPVIEATRYFHNDRIFSTKLVVDALTGASANGAVPSTEFQTFTRPSGNAAYTTAPGETPLDDTFRDTRIALSASWTQPLLSGLTGSFSFNGSNEFDYLSLGLSGVLNWDLNRKNTTLTMGLGVANDDISPVGGMPTPLAEMGYTRGASEAENEVEHEDEFDDDDVEREGRQSSDSKLITDFLFGVTQVIDRRTVAQFNYSLSLADGYLTDPYKVVSVIDPTDGQPLRQLYEQRPDTRSKNSVFARVKRAVGQDDVLDASYRYLWDDWGLNSHTLDLRYRLAFGNRFVQPHLRYYQQSATDFFNYYLEDGAALPTEVSADYRLGDMNAITAGLEYGQRNRNGHEWRLALEYYLQSGDEPANKPGQLAQQTLAPDVDAVMLRFNYDFSL